MGAHVIAEFACPLEYLQSGGLATNRTRWGPLNPLRLGTFQPILAHIFLPTMPTFCACPLVPSPASTAYCLILSCITIGDSPSHPQNSEAAIISPSSRRFENWSLMRDFLVGPL
ncbi:hypothetical protein PM082_008932 [Marasmius tenuissimus]|nr:hypothetical protein PM082_008932 [Marasmius tenuissimus]